MDIEKIVNKAKQIRIDVVLSLTNAGSGHLGASLGLADVFAALYFHLLNHNPEKPEWTERDRLILSIGHVAPVYYASLANVGYFPTEELMTLRKLGSRLQGHPSRNHKLPGIELAAGSLGQGLSVAVGIALAGKIDKKDFTVCSINGDGELQEGSIWEAAMSAAHYKLDNLICVVDRNKVQIDGQTSDVMEIEPLAKKWQSFGWEVFNCDGNSVSNFISTYKKAKEIKGKPSVIIANTKMGKGVPRIENNFTWHGKVPSKDEAINFISILNK